MQKAKAVTHHIMQAYWGTKVFPMSALNEGPSRFTPGARTAVGWCPETVWTLPRRDNSRAHSGNRDKIHQSSSHEKN